MLMVDYGHIDSERKLCSVVVGRTMLETGTAVEKSDGPPELCNVLAKSGRRLLSELLDVNVRIHSM